MGCMCPHKKQSMYRITLSKNGEVSIDLNQNQPGRGAYVCKNDGCFTQMVKKKRLDKTFKHAVNKEVYLTLGKLFQD